MKILIKWLAVFAIVLSGTAVFAQNAAEKKEKGYESIGGAEHEMNVYGVEIGMDIPTALEAVFRNADRKPGQEKPDAMRKEGKNNEDVRVLYNDLPAGSLQIVFAGGKVVSEIVLTYSSRPTIEDLRLASSSDIGVAAGGERYDDRYTIGFVDNKKQEKLWWRDESEGDYKVRLSFRSGNSLKDGQLWWQTVAQKAITVVPGDEKKFKKAFNL
jgi:hypothetical protein